MQENVRQSKYIIKGLNPGTTYNVCLVAHDMHITKMNCENATTAGNFGPTNITLNGTGECVYYQVILLQ